MLLGLAESSGRRAMACRARSPLLLLAQLLHPKVMHLSRRRAWRAMFSVAVFSAVSEDGVDIWLSAARMSKFSPTATVMTRPLSEPASGDREQGSKVLPGR